MWPGAWGMHMKEGVEMANKDLIMGKIANGGFYLSTVLVITSIPLVFYWMSLGSAQKNEERRELIAERQRHRDFEVDTQNRLENIQRQLDLIQADSRKCESVCGIRAELEMLRKTPCSK